MSSLSKAGRRKSAMLGLALVFMEFIKFYIVTIGTPLCTVGCLLMLGVTSVVVAQIRFNQSRQLAVLKPVRRRRLLRLRYPQPLVFIVQVYGHQTIAYVATSLFVPRLIIATFMNHQAEYLPRNLSCDIAAITYVHFVTQESIAEICNTIEEEALQPRLTSTPMIINSVLLNSKCVLSIQSPCSQSRYGSDCGKHNYGDENLANTGVEFNRESAQVVERDIANVMHPSIASCRSISEVMLITGTGADGDHLDQVSNFCSLDDEMSNQVVADQRSRIRKRWDRFVQNFTCCIRPRPQN